MVLDEPTNDLDMQMIGILEKALIDFEGCEIIISHDRYFLDKVCTHILYLKGDGEYVLSSGGWTNFENKYHNKIEELTTNKKSIKLNQNDPYSKFLQQKKLKKIY